MTCAMSPGPYTPTTHIATTRNPPTADSVYHIMANHAVLCDLLITEGKERVIARGQVEEASCCNHGKFTSGHQ